jgi:hypothetical protein
MDIQVKTSRNATDWTKYLLRIPLSWRQEIEQAAREQFVSVAQYLRNAVRQSLDMSRPNGGK